MPEFFALMLRPFLACLLLAGIHAYLGLHVIERGVIFVDLALAQLAALGTAIGVLCGLTVHTWPSYLCALAFTLVGAMTFALTRLRHARVPQEAIIGIVYIVAAAASVVALSRSAHGAEDIEALLVGNILFVQWPALLKTLLIYGVIGWLHWRWRQPLLAISQHAEQAFKQGLSVRWWDFLFYTTFGFVVTSSVQMAGVLLVFTFLVVPAVCAALLADAIGARLAIGWVLGALGSVIGVTLSYLWDLPTGATVVCVFGALLVLVGLWLRLRRYVA